MDLQNINVIKTVVVFCYTVVTIATFAFAEKIDWSMAFILAIGSGLGGFFGSVIIVKVNPKIVKIFIFVIGVAFSFYLLFSP